MPGAGCALAMCICHAGLILCVDMSLCVCFGWLLVVDYQKVRVVMFVCRWLLDHSFVGCCPECSP
jgi:hypothetical protein